MLELIVWDVQHGSAAYIKTPREKHIVIDLGTGSYVGEGEDFSPLMYLKNKLNINRLDQVIITHPHTDHLTDIFNFDELSPRVLRRPKHLKDEDIRNANPDYDNEIIEKYLEIDERYCHPVSDNDNPTLPQNNGGVSFKFFLSKNCPVTNINNHSIVTVVEYLGIKIIIPGDNELESWNELLKDSEFINAIKDADVFVASHHGRESGYCAELFEYFQPKLVIISDDEASDPTPI